jgi:hypothetical protein
MEKHVLALIVGWLAIAPAVAVGPAEVIFRAKLFADIGDIVHVEGTLTGDGVGYKNNRSALTCYREARECLAIHIDSAGLQVFSIYPPIRFTVRLWTADRIMADLAEPCGNPPNELFKREWQTTVSDTWIIDRARQTAELIDHPCAEAKTHHWTIEDPPFWKKIKERLGESKPGR